MTDESQKTVGRPKTGSGDDVLILDATHATSNLHPRGERAAVINRMVMLGGRATVNELTLCFGYDIDVLIRKLVSAGWLRRVPAEQAAEIKLPRRTSPARTLMCQNELLMNDQS